MGPDKACVRIFSAIWSKHNLPIKSNLYSSPVDVSDLMRLPKVSHRGIRVASSLADQCVPLMTSRHLMSLLGYCVFSIPIVSSVSKGHLYRRKERPAEHKITILT